LADLTSVLEIAAYVSFVLGAVFAVYELRIIGRDRQTELIMRVSEFMCTKEFEEPLCRLWKTNAHDAEGLERDVSYEGLSMICDYSEGLSSLVERHLLREDLVKEQYAFGVLWEKMKPWILELRKEYPHVYHGFERLATDNERV